MTSTPQEPFSDPRAELRSRLLAIVEGSGRPSSKERIIYRIAGGPPGKRFESELAISGTGAARHSFLDELEGPRRVRTQTKLTPKDVLELFQMVLDSQMLKADETTHGFLPDSVVGSITVESGDARVTEYFHANERHLEAGSDEGRARAAQVEGLAPLLPRLERLVTRPSGKATRRDERRR